MHQTFATSVHRLDAVQHRDIQRITKHLTRFLETYTVMLALVEAVLRLVPLKADVGLGGKIMADL